MSPTLSYVVLIPWRNDRMPWRTQFALLPPAVHGSFIEFVRSKMTMMWAGLATPCPMAAVALR